MIYGCSEFPATIALANLVTDQENFGFTINGDNEDDALGTELGPAGDINGDGIDDLILGAPSANVPDLPSSGYRAGKIFVVYGRAADVDGDGISDLLDNCTFVANPDQRDTNGDGFGNICDPDLNNDGVVNFIDIAEWIPFFNTQSNGDEDFDGNGAINFLDFSIMIQFFLSPPGPAGSAVTK